MSPAPSDDHRQWVHDTPDAELEKHSWSPGFFQTPEPLLPWAASPGHFLDSQSVQPRGCPEFIRPKPATHLIPFIPLWEEKLVSHSSRRSALQPRLPPTAPGSHGSAPPFTPQPDLGQTPGGCGCWGQAEPPALKSQRHLQAELCKGGPWAAKCMV